MHWCALVYIYIYLFIYLIYIYIYLSNMCNFKACWGSAPWQVSPGLPILHLLHPEVAQRGTFKPAIPWLEITCYDLIWRPDFFGQFSWATTIRYCLGLKILDHQTCISSYGWTNDKILRAHVCPKLGRKWLFANSPLPQSFYLTCIFFAKLPQCSLAHPQVSFLKTIR